MRNRRLEGIEAIIERQQPVPTEGHDDGLGASDPVARFSLTISLTNLTETSKRAAAE